jgi:hypothetical protein
MSPRQRESVTMVVTTFMLGLGARLVDSRLVTDDNMAPEWSEPLNLPIVSTESPHRVVGF